MRRGKMLEKDRHTAKVCCRQCTASDLLAGGLRIVAAGFLSCLLGGLCWSIPAAAFSGAEHRDLSNLALEIALHEFAAELPQETLDEITWVYLHGLPRSANAPGPRLAERRSFGDLVKSLDYFKNPNNLVRTKNSFDHFWNRIGRRRKSFLQRLWALHTNAHHFQDGAVEVYQQHHHLAIEAAMAFVRSDEADLEQLHEAILHEAVALHFLQDFFAAGHIATPRAGWADLPAASLHDRYSRVGLPFVVEPAADSCEGTKSEWSKTLCDIESWIETAPGLQGCDGSLKLHAGDLASVRELDGLELIAEEAHHFGDRRLRHSSPQKVFLLGLTLRSISEVLESLATAKTPEKSIQLCFLPWTALASEPQHWYETLKPRKGSIEPPEGGARLAPWAEARKLHESCPREKGWQGRYLLQGHPELAVDNHRTPGFGLNLRRGWTDSGKREVLALHVDWVLVASAPENSIVDREEVATKGLDKARRINDGVSIVGNYGLAYLSGDDFSALGLHVGGNFNKKSFQISYWLGHAEYNWDGNNSTKIRYGLQAGIDILLGHASFGVEQIFTPNGADLEPTLLYTVGTQIQIPFSWFPKYFGKK